MQARKPEFICLGEQQINSTSDIKLTKLQNILQSRIMILRLKRKGSIYQNYTHVKHVRIQIDEIRNVPTMETEKSFSYQQT